MDSSNKYIQLVGGFVAVIFGVLQGIDWLFKRFEIDSLYFNIILIILLVAFIISISIYFLRRKKAKSTYKKPAASEVAHHAKPVHHKRKTARKSKKSRRSRKTKKSRKSRKSRK